MKIALAMITAAMLSGCAFGVGIVAAPIAEIAGNGVVSDFWKARCDELGGDWIPYTEAGGPACDTNG